VYACKGEREGKGKRLGEGMLECQREGDTERLGEGIDL
jgi:hypothetical protein